MLSRSRWMEYKEVITGVYMQRSIKTKEEVTALITALRVAETGLRRGIDVLKAKLGALTQRHGDRFKPRPGWDSSELLSGSRDPSGKRA